MPRRRKHELGLVHPGQVLKTEFLEPFGLSVSTVSDAIKVPRARLLDIVHGRRAVDAETAVRLSRYFRPNAQFWMDLQLHYDLRAAEETHGKRLDREIRPHVPEGTERPNPPRLGGVRKRPSL